MTRFGLRYARGNVLLGPDGEAAGLYRLGTTSYPFLAVTGKRRLAAGLERFMQLVGADFSLWRVSRAYPADRYLADARELLDDCHQDPQAWEQFLSGHEVRLAELGSHVPEVYFAIALAGERPARWGGGLFRSLDAVRRRVEDLAGVAAPLPIPASKLERLAVAVQHMYERLTGVLRARRATTRELQWLLRRAATRGLGEPLIDAHWRPDASLIVQAPDGRVAYEPLETDIWRCANAAITEHDRTLVVTGDDGLAGAAHGPGLLAAEDRVLARELEASLQGGARPPMLYASLSLAVGAPSEEELERRVEVLREQYGDVALHRPVGLQQQLFEEHLPTPGGGRVADYRQQLTVGQFGALVPTATRTVGSTGGPYLGYVASGSSRPVRFDPTAAPRESRASAVLLAGTLGSGKTVAAELIAYAAERRGSLVVDFDPKPDHGWHRLPELADRLEVLELSGDPAQQGRLDPLRIGLPELREELAASYLLELLRDPPPSWENAISRAVKQLIHHGSRNLTDVIPMLRAFEGDAAREAADALEVICDFGLARLGFARDDQQAGVR